MTASLMNPNDRSDLSVETLLALRQENDAMQVIIERLKVKEMGPADHIRTKHEVKAFVESSGGLKEAEAIIERAHARCASEKRQTAAVRITERKSHGIKQ